MVSATQHEFAPAALLKKYCKHVAAELDAKAANLSTIGMKGVEIEPLSILELCSRQKVFHN